ncbi:MAG: tRNA (adenosine(37)-N6)-threonylcarbamoyltransferase complex dimerization subunit type 1 TsaB [Defluviitaleaceae bacterium]|nr:tRNA (adenosine(37)-N6)-threonylcarbamoyltransferase complex dimerization subunit type 1 TsaB [Defluviitaleaceae bacterium]
MKILAIDTSGKQAGAAIVDEYITIGEILINAQSGPKSWHHSEILMPSIERLFSLSGLTVQDMDYVAYTSGPGSFTGIRIGASTALGLARSINRPWVAVPTLDALAYNVLYISEGTLVVPLLDARRGQVYGAVYVKEPSGKLTRLTDYFASEINEALEKAATICNGGNLTPAAEYDQQLIFLGDGADANKLTIQDKYPAASFAPANANRQRPASVALCAMDQLKTKVNDKTVKMIYVRDPQAVRSLKKT